MADSWEAAGKLTLFDLPYPAPPVEVGLMFLRERPRDPAIAWMRDLIEDVARGI